MNENRRVISPALLALARRAGDGDLPPSATRRARDDLAAQLSRRPASPFRKYGPMFAAATLCVSLVVLAFDSLRLHFSVSGAAMMTPAGYVRADDDVASITFSDGTQVALAPRSTVRVGTAGLRGADLVQERGRATYAVVHRPAANWSVEAGPYRVRVTGTKFAVTWSPEPGELVTELYEGSVIIEGPQAEGGVQLHAGERLRASVGGQVVVEDLRTATESTPTPSSQGTLAKPENGSTADTSAGLAQNVPQTPEASAGSSPDEQKAPEVPAGSSHHEQKAPEVSAGSSPDEQKAPDISPAAPSSPAPLSLAARLAQGDAQAIAAEVDREGITSFAARVSAADLAIVADAARYAKRPALANAAFLALRQRHPGTREAAVAAFHLGRAADESNPTRAISWYDVYLAETSGAGAFASEARGRKMSAVKRSSGDAAAKPLAEAYLAQHPKGSYAQLARAILAAP